MVKCLMVIKVVAKPGAKLPVYKTAGASGADVEAFLDSPVELLPFERAAIPTGLFFEIPTGYEVQVRPRSGLALNNGVTVLNAPGTIDSDYRGELKIILINLSQKNFIIKNGDRIAQLVAMKVEKMQFQAVGEIAKTIRLDGGFGSTGV